MNQDEDTTIQKLTPGIWHGRVIRHEHNEVPGQIILIEDREYFFPENNPSIFFSKKNWLKSQISKFPTFQQKEDFTFGFHNFFDLISFSS